jgi:hypothetical protein
MPMEKICTLYQSKNLQLTRLTRPVEYNNSIGGFKSDRIKVSHKEIYRQSLMLQPKELIQKTIYKKNHDKI